MYQGLSSHSNASDKFNLFPHAFLVSPLYTLWTSVSGSWPITVFHMTVLTFVRDYLEKQCADLKVKYQLLLLICYITDKFKRFSTYNQQIIYTLSTN